MSADLRNRLPHRSPFLFISTATTREDGSVVATWVVDGSEDFFRGHFPGKPIVPGVLIGEALAQCAGLVLAASQKGGGGGMLAALDMRFRKPVIPPATIELSAVFLDGIGAIHRFNVEARVANTVVANGIVVLAVPASGRE